MSLLTSVCINQVEFRENVRTFFVQGQSKLPAIMRYLIKWVSIKRALTVLFNFQSSLLIMLRVL